MDLTKGFRIESDGTVLGTKVYDSDDELIGGFSYLELCINSEDYRPYVRIDYADDPNEKCSQPSTGCCTSSSSS